MIAASLDQAFRSAHYRVFSGSGTITTEIDHRSDALARLLAAEGVASAVLLTAHNPGGRRTEPSRNQQQQAQLEAALQALGCRWLGAEGAAPDRHWVEPSLLIFDLSCEQAAALAARFGQAAYVLYDRHGSARLCYCERTQP